MHGFFALATVQAFREEHYEEGSKRKSWRQEVQKSSQIYVSNPQSKSFGTGMPAFYKDRRWAYRHSGVRR